MKIVIITFFMLILSSQIAAQDSTAVKEKKEKPAVEVGKTDNTPFDKKGKNDVFIDKDGDGICDFRAKGMSFEKFRKRNHQGAGDGKGKGKGNH